MCLTAQPFVPKQYMKDIQDFQKDVILILDTITEDTKTRKEESLVQILKSVDTSSECINMLSDLFLVSAVQNYKNLTDFGRIPSISDLCIRIDRELFNGSLKVSIFGHCLALLRTCPDEDNEDINIGKTALMADITSKIEHEEYFKLIVDEVCNLSQRKERPLLMCALAMYRKIAPKLHEQKRIEIERNLWKHCRSNTFISGQIKTIMKELGVERKDVSEKELEGTSSDEEGSETNSQQNSTDSDSEKKRTVQSPIPSIDLLHQKREKEAICAHQNQSITDNDIIRRNYLRQNKCIFAELSLIIHKEHHNETEIRDWMLEFKNYIKKMTPSEIISGQFGRQLSAHIIELATVIYASYLRTTLFSELCSLVVAFQNEQTERGVASENKFRSILLAACQSHYDKSYLYILDEQTKTIILAITHFIRNLYDANFVYGTIITLAINSHLQDCESYLQMGQHLRLECALILLRDSYDKLDRSCRMEINDFYCQLKTYYTECRDTRLREEIEALISKRETDIKMKTSPVPRGGQHVHIEQNNKEVKSKTKGKVQPH